MDRIRRYAAPSAPANLTVSQAGASLKLGWSASTDNIAVAGYKIERSAKRTDGWTQIGTSTGSGYSDNLSAADQNKTWYYEVRAFDAAGNLSLYSAVVSGYADTQLPSAPANLTVVQSGASLNLSWTASTDNVGVAGYKIERSASAGGSWAEIATTTATSFADALSAADQNKTWYYRVRAYDAVVNISPYSSVGSGYMPDITSPGVPGALTAAARRAPSTLHGTVRRTMWASRATGSSGVRMARADGARSQPRPERAMRHAVRRRPGQRLVLTGSGRTMPPGTFQDIPMWFKRSYRT